jgi:hypothetical protein
VIRGRGSVTYSTGEMVEVQTLPIDLLHWERYRARHKLGADPRESPFTFELYVLYSACQRDGYVGELGFDPWCESLADVELELGAEDPTTTGASAA